ncbi:DUF6766 family protein [Lysobacter silvisoli]|uniref:Transmembrane protein n=1 Tax=Lysobacter silvisoli TaxID=2293254 RepID=A0A371K4X7_9GAMM|nr:DUF6766 family protein [Lysobacter silvisoli]RDZ28948.1 hypothetical protein DX914_07555 [Lysobacter silvisoli]
MAGFWKRNGLSLVLLALFAATFAGQMLAGHRVYNREQVEAGLPPVTLPTYLQQGHFISATFENWESEFLQMGWYVLLTVWLRQRGSAESRPMDEEDEPPERIAPGPTPWAARAGGWVRAVYANSLSIALLALFAVSFVLHACGSWKQHAEELLRQGQPVPSLPSYLGDAQFWFESFQNWQSEFLAVLTLVVLSIFLRQHDSPQSKAVDAPHSQTGT